MKTRRIILAVFVWIAFTSLMAAVAGERWSEDRANAWARRTGWLVGCNFTPSTAINQLEMWQADTFDPVTIDRELGWAEQLGFNSVRVFLHNIPWQEDAPGFVHRLDRFLAIADRHHIGVMFVLLDACWDPFPKAGPQRAPRPFVHNSGWVQCPGRDILANPARHDELKPYVTGVIGHFRNDRRVHFWDLFNEPDNINQPAYVAQEPPDKAEFSLMLLRKVFAWAREVNPSQPVTAGVWAGDWEPGRTSPVNRFMLENSDIITFHDYAPLDELRSRVATLEQYGRPVICTEYMARPAGSTFDPNLAFLKEHNVGAYNWGFVAGKTQTIFPWDSWEKHYTAEPKVWFHDILRPDGTPFDAQEVAFIKRVTGRPTSALKGR